MDPMREEQFMKRAAIVLGIVAVVVTLALPATASGGNGVQVVKPEISTVHVAQVHRVKVHVAQVHRVKAARIVTQRATTYRLSLHRLR
jgi:hypothetical protein